MRVGFEVLAWGLHTWDYRDVWEIVRRANRANVGIVLDTFHIQASDLDLSVIRTIPADRIFLVQVADAPKLQMDYLSWSRHWRCMPGQGDFDLVGFMTALEATGYRGHLPLEIFNDRFRAGSSRAVALDGHCSLLSLLDEASRHLGRPVSDLPPCRPRPSWMVSSSSNSRCARPTAQPSKPLGRPWASARAAGTAQRLFPCGGRARSGLW
jgi:4-hydroxyphenylpyruvate dioxygenase